MVIKQFTKIAMVVSTLGMAATVSANKLMDNFNKAPHIITSPDGKNKLAFMNYGGKAKYSIARNNNVIIGQSVMGFVLNKGKDLSEGMRTAGVTERTVDSTWEQPWGEQRYIRDNYNELRVKMKKQSGEKHEMFIVFRAFNDGVAFRYEIPMQSGLEKFEIMDEVTQFNMFGGYTTWPLPAFKKNRYEYLYNKIAVHKIPANDFKTHTPFTMKGKNIHVSIHEASLTDFSSMTLKRIKNALFEAELVPWSDGSKVKVSNTRVSPWRTIQLADDAAGLLESTMILNLNEPSKLSDTSWIKPGKYMGIWWGMHLDKYSWGAGPKHGATTENAKKYIDFAADNGFAGVLVEGWNIGWDGDWYKDGSGFDFTKAYDDFNINEVAQYGKEKGALLIGHHETSGAITNYENQLEAAFKLYNKLGVKAVKTGYVQEGQGIERHDENGNIIGKEWHHGQYMVNHYRKTTKMAAKYNVMVIAHEPIKDTGIRRTWPNMMTREGARGQEFNAWSNDGGNPPNHTAILPFTRCLGGPFDFTPGIFDVLFEKERPDNRVNTTLAKQLALYLTIYSPHQMAADLPENYENVPAFKFIKDVPTDWEKSIALNGEVGEYVTIARKDRNSDEWFLGSLTNEKGRMLEVNLSFLDADKTYTAEIYADDSGTGYKKNPTAVAISTKKVKPTESLKLYLGESGGTAIRFIPVN